MVPIRLRAVRAEDLPVLTAGEAADDPFGFFALNIGILLLPEHRGRGYGSSAQAAFADYLFDTTLVERLEAGTDV